MDLRDDEAVSLAEGLFSTAYHVGYRPFIGMSDLAICFF